jgi:hypothetical protein
MLRARGRTARSLTFRPSNGRFSVTVEDAQLALPTLEGSPSGAFLERA